MKQARDFRCALTLTSFLISSSLTILLMALPLCAQQPSLRILDSGWQFRAVASTIPAGNADAASFASSNLSDWHPAQVPGVVQTDLLQNKIIPDPFDRDNEYRLQWIGLADWEYQTVFQVDAAALAREHVDLVFDGLDTFADVYLNDQAILHSDNMFRQWRAPAKAQMKQGPNTLRIVFHSAIEKMIPYVKSLPYMLPSISTHNAGNEEDIPTAPYTRKAPYHYGWDWGPRFMTEGIWRPVRLESWDAIRIVNFHIHQQKVSAEAALITAELDIEASRPLTTTLALGHNIEGATSSASAHESRNTAMAHRRCNSMQE